MGLFGALSGLVEPGVSLALTPLAAGADLLEGDASLTSTRSCVTSAAKGAAKTINKTLTIPTDPFDEEDWD